MYYNQQYADGFPSFTFIGGQEALDKPLERQHLQSAYLLLKYKPTCPDCTEDVAKFRASGKAKAEEKIVQHKGYKKYQSHNPIVEELTFDLPEFLSISQLFGTDANRKRNEQLRNQMDTADQYSYPTVMDGYQLEKGVSLEFVRVIRKSEIRTVKQGSMKVCDLTLQDANGDTISLTLWNEQTETINLDDVLTIKNAFVKEGWQGGIELGTWKNATSIEVVQN